MVDKRKEYKIKNICCKYEDSCLTIEQNKSIIKCNIEEIVSLYVVLRDVIENINKEDGDK